MSLLSKNPNLIKDIIKISKDAGESILDIYHNHDSDFDLKEDRSPLTKADISSHRIITRRLKDLTPSIPIISEEDSDIPFKIRSNWKEYWLVDPLDGTKEFLKGNGEYTVNIALISANKPVLGVINIPSLKKIFWGQKDKGSFSINEDNNQKKISVSGNKEGPIRIAASRSHYNNELDLILENNNDYQIINVGSSIKFCLIASGEADVYVRLGPTSEWDTAAGDAILRFAGGETVTEDGEDLVYNTKESYLNGNFFAIGNNEIKDTFLSRFSST
tara:strand:+ start:116 stop:937 length:822 start_codon:yes stop_codon:yes gene_type:complete